MTTGATGNQLRLRLFLEGIEVPVIGAQVQMNLNAPATASIQVLPLDKVMELKPRTMVHLFFWDYTLDLPDPAEVDNKGLLESLENEEDVPDPVSQLDGYKLLFGGEVTGLIMSKSATGRQAVLQCADWSTYWDTSYQTFISYSPGGNFLGDNSAVWAGGNNMFHNILSSHASVMSNHLKKKPKSPGMHNVKGLLGGIISLLETMGGVPKHTSGINDYFTIAELKNHLLAQLTAEQNDSSAKRLFNNKAFDSWLNGQMTSLGELVSFRDMLKLLFHWIYYEVVPVPAPMYVPAVSSKSVEKKIRVYGDHLNTSQQKVIKDLIKTSQKYDGSAGKDVAWANQRDVSEKAEAAGIYTLLVVILGIDAGGKFVSAVSPPSLQINPKRLNSKTIKAVKTAMTKAEAIQDTVVGKSKLVVWKTDRRTTTITIGGVPREITTERVLQAGPTENPRVDIPYYNNQKKWLALTKALRDILGKGRIKTLPPSHARKTKAEVDRLQTQIFRPDCFFVPPPKCNVLFPDQYINFQYRRNFLQEVTRLRLTTGLQYISGPGAGFLNKSNFAPAIKDIRELAKKQGNSGLRTLLPWEKFTGILPKFEYISEVNYYANKGNRREKQTKKDVKGQANSYAQRAANFNFIKYRFAPRSMSVSAKFNPFMVPGFPVLVIDKPFVIEPDDVQQAFAEAGVGEIERFDLGDFISNIGPLAQYFKAPTQYLGMPAGISHAVDQQGGVTSVTLTHARTHRTTDDDFLDIFAAEVTRKKTKVIKKTVLNAKDLLAQGDYKKLKLLINLTPQNILQQMETGLPQDQEKLKGAVPKNDDLLGNDLESGPDTTPPLASLSQLAPVLIPQTEATRALFGTGEVITLVNTTTRDLTNVEAAVEGVELGFELELLRGGTTKNVLTGTSTTITEPSEYGKIKKGDKGLDKKGRIAHIQLPSDSVLQIASGDLNQYAKSRNRRRASRRNKKGREKTYYMWNQVVLHEEVTARKQVKDIPVEEALRPPWFSPLYSNMFIGPEIYGKFFGTGAIVDQSLYLTPEGDAFFSKESERDEILAEVRAADGDSVKIAQILEDNSDNKTLISEIPSIETSVDALAFIYGEVRRQGLDVQRFIANYTARPIATMRDIFGSIDLWYEKDGDGLKLVSGSPGFHSTAVASFGELRGLVDNPDLELPRLTKRSKKFPISKALDPRPERKQKVRDYAKAIGGSRGSLGRGILG